MYLSRPKKVVLRATKPGCDPLHACSLLHLQELLAENDVLCSYWRITTSLNYKARRLKGGKRKYENDSIDGWEIERLNSTISKRRREAQLYPTMNKI